ncbi:hypothetical protein BD289DRAFT_147069 [Coniella lustricola]|uniref:Uncharacterized protein n=1 Tax=Coniella lustricola TaxID=2025994 RepID=A0A2T2ZUZ6_9PEZI|nr:hypothetical protein BD289DRAFT_147069 [Coniella lustricola]
MPSFPSLQEAAELASSSSQSGHAPQASRHLFPFIFAGGPNLLSVTILCYFHCLGRLLCVFFPFFGGERLSQGFNPSEPRQCAFLGTRRPRVFVDLVGIESLSSFSLVATTSYLPHLFVDLVGIQSLPSFSSAATTSRLPLVLQLLDIVANCWGHSPSTSVCWLSEPTAWFSRYSRQVTKKHDGTSTARFASRLRSPGGSNNVMGGGGKIYVSHPSSKKASVCLTELCLPKPAWRQFWWLRRMRSSCFEALQKPLYSRLAFTSLLAPEMLRARGQSGTRCPAYD